MIFFSPARFHWVEKLPTQSMAALKINQSLRIGLGWVIELESFSKPNREKKKKKKLLLKYLNSVFNKLLQFDTIFQLYKNNYQTIKVNHNQVSRS